MAAEQSTSDGLLLARRERVLEITLDRPERRNALTPGLIESLLAALEAARGDETVRAVLLTGSGTKAFCAGFDLGHVKSAGADDGGAERDLVDHLASTIRAHPLSFVAAVNGAAIGGGCDLAVACDIRLGHARTTFGMPTAKLGFLYGLSGIERLVHTVGLPMAKEMLLTAELVPADRAARVGLLSEVVAEHELLPRARAVADRIAANAPLSVAASKQLVDLIACRRLSDEEHAEMEAIQRRVWTSHDAAEGPRAYRERRAPNFIGT